MNSHSYDLIENKCRFIYEGEEYVIDKHTEIPKGNTKQVNVVATHEFYENLKQRNFVYDTISGTKSLKELLEHALKGSGYSLHLNSTELEEKKVVENFGNNNSLALLEDAVGKYSAEFDYSNRDIYVAKEISRKLEAQLRYMLNVSNLSKDIDTTELRTYIRGYGKKDENENYIVTTEYTSPLAEKYGILIADPIENEWFVHEPALKEHIKNALNDSIKISIELTAHQLEEMNITDIKKGDWVWCILDPFDINMRVRVVEVEDSEDENAAPVFRLGELKKKVSRVVSNLNSASKKFDKIFDNSTGKVKGSTIDTSNLSVDLSLGKGNLPPGAVTIGLASSLTDGLMSSTQFNKLESITLDEHGNISIPLADAFRAGLMSIELFNKLNAIQVDANGQVIVDLSAINTKFTALEQRVAALESGGNNS